MCPGSLLLAAAAHGGSVHLSEAHIRNEWIRSAFVPEGRRGSMSRDEHHVIAQRPQFSTDGIDQGVVIPAREIGAADRTLKQHIAHQRKAYTAMEKDQMARSVAGAMQNFQRLLAERQGVAIIEPAIGLERFRRRKACAPRRLAQLIKPEFILDMRPFNRYAEFLAHDVRSRTMIEMRMRQEDFFQREAELFHHRAQARHLPTWVDQGGALRLFTYQDAAVLLVRRDRHDGAFHGRNQESRKKP
jgi:hypothetical protein